MQTQCTAEADYTKVQTLNHQIDTCTVLLLILSSSYSAALTHDEVDGQASRTTTAGRTASTDCLAKP